MSMSLYWIPETTQDPPGYVLSDQLKFAMRKITTGSISVTLNEGSKGYLRGLLHAGIEDAQILLDAIDEYERIIVYEE